MNISAENIARMRPGLPWVSQIALGKQMVAIGVDMDAAQEKVVHLRKNYSKNGIGLAVNAPSRSHANLSGCARIES
jgi:hypothetical protein